MLDMALRLTYREATHIKRLEGKFQRINFSNRLLLYAGAFLLATTSLTLFVTYSLARSREVKIHPCYILYIDLLANFLRDTFREPNDASQSFYIRLLQNSCFNSNPPPAPSALPPILKVWTVISFKIKVWPGVWLGRNTD